MNPTPSSPRATSPRGPLSHSRARAPVRPDIRHHLLNVVLDEVEQPGLSPRKRFHAWNDALTISLHAGIDSALDWLGYLHATGANGSNQFDACIVLHKFDVDQLEKVFEWLDRDDIRLPVDVTVDSSRIHADEAAHGFMVLMQEHVSNIRSLRICGTTRSISPSAFGFLVQFLQGNRALRSLGLPNCGLHDPMLEELAQAIQGCVLLASLDISGNLCGKAGLAALAEVIKHQQNLRSLTLNELGLDGGLQAIFESLPPGIEELHLKSCCFSKADGKALGRLLANTTTLKVLDLGHSKRLEHDADDLSKARRAKAFVRSPRSSKEARKARALAERQARTDKQTAEAMALIFEGIACNRTLTTLHIEHWPLDMHTVESLCQALVRPGCRLRKLSMSLIEDQDLLKALAVAAAQNNSLLWLDLPGDGIECLQQAVKRNDEARTAMKLRLAGAGSRNLATAFPLPLEISAHIGSYLNASDLMKLSLLKKPEQDTT